MRKIQANEGSFNANDEGRYTFDVTGYKGGQEGNFLLQTTTIDIKVPCHSAWDTITLDESEALSFIIMSPPGITDYADLFESPTLHYWSL